MAFAKAITSGYFPLGGIGVNDKIGRAIDAAADELTWMHAFTYSAHPVGCAVALANLDIIEREGLVERAGAGRSAAGWAQDARVASARRRRAWTGLDGSRRAGGG